MKKTTIELLLLGVLLYAGWWYYSTNFAPKAQSTTTAPIISTTGQHSVTGGPSLSASQVDSILSRAGSPAAGTGQTFYAQSLATGINDAFALAFFNHESSYGLAGEARYSKSIGNLRCIPSAPCPDGYAHFKTWEDGITAWYYLIRNLYINTWHLATVEAIIPRYAPAADHNNESAYIRSVVATVSSYEQAA